MAFTKGVIKMAKYVASIDQGTTSTRCMIFTHDGQPVGQHQLEHEQIYPKPGWVEHDPKEIWERTQEVVKVAMRRAGATAADIAAVGITNQRETTVVWNKKTGEAYGNALVWQDTRTDRIVNELSKDGGQDRFRPQVGLPLATYFSGPKVKWMLDNVPGLRAKRPKKATPSSATSTPGSSGISPAVPRGGVARHRRDQCQPDHAHEPGNPFLELKTIAKADGPSPCKNAAGNSAHPLQVYGYTQE
jgi:hypothetical protein